MGEKRMNAPLVLKDFSGVPEITQDAWRLKAKALALARPIAKVETIGEQLKAVDALTELKAVRSGMEQTRKAVKAPVLALGRKIDDIAHNFLADVDKQFMRISGMVSHYQKKLAREKAAEEEKSLREQQNAEALHIAARKLREQAVNEIG